MNAGQMVDTPSEKKARPMDLSEEEQRDKEERGTDLEEEEKRGKAEKADSPPSVWDLLNETPEDFRRRRRPFRRRRRRRRRTRKWRTPRRMIR